MPFAGEKILLFVHGATYPSETAFDLQLNGLSWMEYIAQHGYDVYLVDVRGYGKSTRPPEMDKPAADNEPIVRTETAVKDVGAAVDFILKRRGVSKINLLGWSWGTTIMGWYTAQNNDKVNRLVLYAPQWFRNTAVACTDSGGKLGAYRTVSRDAAKGRWLTGVPEDKKADLIPPGWFEAWADATFATDPVGSKQTPPVLRAPNGWCRTGASSGARASALRPGRDPRPHLPRARRVGCRPAQLHAVRLLRQADQRAVQALRGDRRRHAYGHHGEEPHAAFPGGSAVPR